MGGKRARRPGQGRTGGRGGGPPGSLVRRDCGGRVRRVKTGGYQWSDEAEEQFFDLLAASCNVRASAEATGFTAFTVYRQRRMRPDFAEKWRVALEQGYARLELALLQAANDSVEGVEFDAERPIPKMTVEQAMNVLRAHRNEVRGGGEGRRGPGRRSTPPKLEEVRASIAMKVRAIIAARPSGGGGGGENRGEVCGGEGAAGEGAATGRAVG